MSARTFCLPSSSSLLIAQLDVHAISSLFTPDPAFTMSHPSFNFAQYLRDPKVQACVADQVNESMMAGPLFNQLKVYADREIATQNMYFVDEPDGSAILCSREGMAAENVQETTFYATGVFLNRHEGFVPSAHQYVVLADNGDTDFKNFQKAIQNFWVMACLRRPEGKLRPLNDLVINGNQAICISTPISTPRNRMCEGDEPLTLTADQDSQGIVMQAGEYELHSGVCGAFLRQGQIVQVEVSFKIVPAGHQFCLRMDLKSVVIINDDIVATMAWAEADAEAAEKTNVISVSSAGPSGTAIKVKGRSKVKRVPRKPKNLVKEVEGDADMCKLPFQSS
ncbi:unnamed protein product [Peniophora sp. CBMAI 1063]|nr:unnamed protein product [Peniophora sp. CBMAI 1063]